MEARDLLHSISLQSDTAFGNVCPFKTTRFYKLWFKFHSSFCCAFPYLSPEHGLLSFGFFLFLFVRRLYKKLLSPLEV